MNWRIFHHHFVANQASWLWLAMVMCGVSLVASGQPANDSFAGRTVIQEAGGEVVGSLAGATSEPDEPFIAGVSSGQTAWWTWTAPSNGIVTLSAHGSGFAPLLSIYKGTGLAGSTLVASNNHVICYEHTSCGCHWRVRGSTTFHVARGEAYHIAVDSAVLTDNAWQQIQPVPPDTFQFPQWESILVANTPPGGPVSVHLQLTPAPQNDDFENRIGIRGSRPYFWTSNAGATREAGEPDHLANPGGSSVWYSWTAPVSGRVTLSANEIAPYSPPTWSSVSVWLIGDFSISTPSWNVPPSCGNEIDQNPLPIFFPVFAAYTGSSVDSLTSANSLPVALPDYLHAIAFDVVKGETYQLAFDGNQGTTGNTPFYLALTKPASNDKFSRRIRLRGAHVIATGYNAGATSQPGESVVFGNSTGKTVWWSWKAPVSGTVSIDLGGSDYSFPVAVFTGSTVASLVMVASGSGSSSFEAVERQSYQIAVGDDAGYTGAIRLRLQAPIVELPLSRVASRGSKALLRYSATSGQVILLLRSEDGENWQNVRTALARRGAVSFLVRPPPEPSGPFYRAVVFDRIK